MKVNGILYFEDDMQPKHFPPLDVKDPDLFLCNN